MRKFVAICAGLILCGTAGSALAQSRTGSDSATSRRSSGNDPLVAWAAIWGDTKHEGVYTCDEWKRYATKLFNDADKNRDNYVDIQEFKAIQQADLILKTADLAYFDDNHDGQLSRAEFVDKPNQFFVRYDKKGQCRVTMDEIIEAAGAALKARERQMMR